MNIHWNTDSKTCNPLHSYNVCMSQDRPHMSWCVCHTQHLRTKCCIFLLSFCAAAIIQSVRHLPSWPCCKEKWRQWTSQGIWWWRQLQTAPETSQRCLQRHKSYKELDTDLNGFMCSESRWSYQMYRPLFGPGQITEMCRRCYVFSLILAIKRKNYPRKQVYCRFSLL